MENLAEHKLSLKEFHKSSLKKWTDGGGLLTSYTCKHCKKEIDTILPRKDMVSSKGYWDSLTDCPKCGMMNFIQVWPSGKTESIRF